MSNKSQFGIIYLQNYSLKPGADLQIQNKSEAVSKALKKDIERSSLVFLSTLMQVENSTLS
jgi:hypothetical protein